jgi:hypothetical protein
MKLGIARGIGILNGCALGNRVIIKLTVDLRRLPWKVLSYSTESEIPRFLWYQTIGHRPRSPVQSSRLLLVLASVIVLGLGPHRCPRSYFCSFQTFAFFFFNVASSSATGGLWPLLIDSAVLGSDPCWSSPSLTHSLTHSLTLPVPISRRHWLISWASPIHRKKKKKTDVTWCLLHTS